MVAWLTSAKDHQTAIRAVASLRQRGHNIRLDLAGGVNRQARQDALQDLAHTLGVSDIVTFLGVREDVPELLGASNILIHSSHSEGFGLSVIEAFASRTPVVATDIPASGKRSTTDVAESSCHRAIRKAWPTQSRHCLPTSACARN